MATEFQHKVYELCEKIPKGKVSTYAEIAHALGTRAYRAVGTALNKNRHPVVIPCHRVVNYDGRIGGYSRGVEKKIALLRQEGVDVIGFHVADFSKRLFLLK